MYAKLCKVEILSSYIKEIEVGDLLTVQALVTNPLDWHHFYDKISSIKKGERTEFMVVTAEGDRLAGQGDVVDIERWSNRGHYGFKIKIMVKKQKSLTDRRTRAPRKAPPPATEPAQEIPAEVAPKMSAPYVSVEDAVSFKDLLKGSLAMDISA
jgi:hypothetical protein